MAERLTEEEIAELGNVALRAQELVAERAKEVGGFVYGADRDIDDLATDILRLVSELEQTREELERLRGLAREFFELSEQRQEVQFLTNEQLWRYDQIGQEISPESYGPAPQG